MNTGNITSQKVLLNRFYFPKTIIAGFVARRTVRSAALWALAFGIYVASKAIGFVDIYPTAAARQKIAETFSNNIGIELLLGKAPHAGTTGAYTAWNTLGVMVTIGAIWALLLAAKYFRGEEDSGRWEMLVSGQTTARKAALNMFAGLGVILGVFYVILSAIFILIGKSHGVDFNANASLFFALAVVLGITIFMMVGALASQLMPTRGQAASISAITLGICFVVRSIADVTNLHWLLNIDPLGWIEKLQPLFTSSPIWLIPTLSLIIILGILTIYFAGKRDLGAAIFTDKSTAKPKTKLLNSPIGVALRLTRSNNIGWLSTFLLIAMFYGLIAKSTAQAFSQSTNVQHVIHRLAQQSPTNSVSAFLGIVFFLQMVLIMTYVASSVTAIRRDEAEGYIDNFLVGPVSRIRWLSSRVFLIVISIVLAGLLTSFGAWIGVVSQHVNISFNTLLSAGVNALIPGILTAGFGIFALGFRPRLTSLIAYGVLIWSFLVEMVSSGLNINHWILDTSVLHHIVLAPAVNPNWTAAITIVFVSVILLIIGAAVFNYRDITPE